MEKQSFLYISDDTIEKYNRLMSCKKLDYKKHAIPLYATIASWTVDFGEGYEVDLKVCSSQDNDPLWCEAVLFKSGCEVTCSEVENELGGDWRFEANGITFIVNVQPLTDQTCILGKGK